MGQTWDSKQMKRVRCIKSYKDVYNWPARDLNKCSKEVALVDIALAQIGSVLNMAVVAQKPSHTEIINKFQPQACQFVHHLPNNVYPNCIAP